MQVARIFARVLIFEIGITAVVGADVPGAVPVDISTILFTFANAFTSPRAFVELVPTCAPGPRNGASAHTEATVVTSSILTKGIELMLPQGPRAAMRPIAELLDPIPGSPPVATR
jgi:hypothetical protein